jgi:hypothetical protein
MAFIRKNFSLEPEKVEQIMALSKMTGFKISELVNAAIGEYLERPRKKIVIKKNGITKTFDIE